MLTEADNRCCQRHSQLSYHLRWELSEIVIPSECRPNILLSSHCFLGTGNVSHVYVLGHIPVENGGAGYQSMA